MLEAMFGGLNRFGPHRLVGLNVWPMGSGTIRRCGLVEGNVSWWECAFKVSYAQPTPSVT